ncbi:hypothetical protein FXO37_02530 [Capsicum annuum]|nr:hypothetical protein FXO37_02530 [Capsicum annuum]
MGVRFYIEIKKSELDFEMYALIITTEDKSASEKLFDDKVGVVMCLENPSEKVPELISYKSKVSAPMPVFDMKGNKIITDSKNSEVKVGQIYKDKCILISVMAKYAIEHSFNFYAKRSGRKINDDAMIFGSHIGLKTFSGGSNAQIEEQKFKKWERENKRARIGSFNFNQPKSEGSNHSQFHTKSSVPALSSASAPVPKFRNASHNGAAGSKTQGSVSSGRSHPLCKECGRHHLGICRAGNDVYFGCAQADRLNQQGITSSAASGQHPNRLYALQSRKDQESPPITVTEHPSQKDKQKENRKLVTQSVQADPLDDHVSHTEFRAAFTTLANSIIAQNERSAAVQANLVTNTAAARIWDFT